MIRKPPLIGDVYVALVMVLLFSCSPSLTKYCVLGQ